MGRHLAAAYVVSQFIGYLVTQMGSADANATADRFRSAWDSVDFIRADEGGAASPTLETITFTPSNISRWIQLPGGDSSSYNSLSGLARVLLHEPWHSYRSLSALGGRFGDPGYQQWHEGIDAWARWVVVNTGLGGGGCPATGGFPGCD